jgi:hypothetical protein
MIANISLAVVLEMELPFAVAQQNNKNKETLCVLDCIKKLAKWCTPPNDQHCAGT